MPPRNACFISFRHGQHELTQRFVAELHAGLSAELEIQLGRDVGVFLDETRLQGGDFFNEAIAEQLCESSCLVMIYTPSYFDLAHTYCAREYKAMLGLEAARLAKLQLDRTHGLIIPVVFRGGKHMPKEIRDVRHCHDFAGFLLTNRNLARHPRYAPAIQEMAEYISDRHRELATIQNGCRDFRLPSEDEIRPWLATAVATPMKLPGRTDD